MDPCQHSNSYFRFRCIISIMKILISSMLLIFAFSSCRQGPSHQSKFPWKPYSKQAIKDSVAHKKPIVIDFFAQWCPNCHELDQTVFSLSQIQVQLAQATALRMDVTDQDDPQVQQILKEYDVEGVPTIIFLNSKAQEIKDSRGIGLVTPKELSEALASLK